MDRENFSQDSPLGDELQTMDTKGEGSQVFPPLFKGMTPILRSQPKTHANTGLTQELESVLGKHKVWSKDRGKKCRYNILM